MPKKEEVKKKTGTRKRKPAKNSAQTSRIGSASRKKSTITGKKVSQGTNPVYALALLGLGALVVIMGTKLYFRGNPGKTVTDGPRKTVKTTERTESKNVTHEKSEKVKDGNEQKEQPSKLIPERNIYVYLIHFNEKNEKMTLTPVARKIRSDTPVADAMEALIRGPGTAEKKKGLLTAIPADLKIIGMTVKNGIAVINFNSAIEKNAGGTIILNRIDQIVYTATQFREVRGVVIQINGRTRKFIGSDGISLSSPLTRQWH